MTTATFTIPGELCDLNSYIDAERTNRYTASKIKKEETERVAMEAHISGIRPITQFPVHMRFSWYTKDLRKDIDNISFAKKFAMDGLVLAGVLPDDSRKYVAGYDGEYFYIGKENPRVVVEIIEYESG
ncbi:MAG: hypothetical protein KGL39_32840 [Patescibacteria group bacterium]|nr:hypothetical protein [Patescibacteria group bacterium]